MCLPIKESGELMVNHLICMNYLKINFFSAGHVTCKLHSWCKWVFVTDMNGVRRILDCKLWVASLLLKCFPSFLFCGEGFNDGTYHSPSLPHAWNTIQNSIVSSTNHHIQYFSREMFVPIEIHLWILHGVVFNQLAVIF